MTRRYSEASKAKLRRPLLVGVAVVRDHRRTLGLGVEARPRDIAPDDLIALALDHHRHRPAVDRALEGIDVDGDATVDLGRLLEQEPPGCCCLPIGET